MTFISQQMWMISRGSVFKIKSVNCVRCFNETSFAIFASFPMLFPPGYKFERGSFGLLSNLGMRSAQFFLKVH